MVTSASKNLLRDNQKNQGWGWQEAENRYKTCLLGSDLKIPFPRPADLQKTRCIETNNVRIRRSAELLNYNNTSNNRKNWLTGTYVPPIPKNENVGSLENPD